MIRRNGHKRKEVRESVVTHNYDWRPLRLTSGTQQHQVQLHLYIPLFYLLSIQHTPHTFLSLSSFVTFLCYVVCLRPEPEYNLCSTCLSSHTRSRGTSLVEVRGTVQTTCQQAQAGPVGQSLSKQYELYFTASESSLTHTYTCSILRRAPCAVRPRSPAPPLSACETSSQ
jgi:hypothetical protein